MKLPRTDAERKRIEDSALRTLLELRKRGGIADLWEAIDLRDPGHPKGQNFDPSSRSGPTSPSDPEGNVTLTSVEAAASDDRVSRDRQELLTALAQLAHVDQVIDKQSRAYPTIQERTAADPRICPPGWCKDHWQNGIFSVQAATDRYRDYCRACGEWRAAYSRSMPAPIMKVWDQRGRRGLDTKLIAEHAPYALDERAS